MYLTTPVIPVADTKYRGCAAFTTGGWYLQEEKGGILTSNTASKISPEGQRSDVIHVAHKKTTLHTHTHTIATYSYAQRKYSVYRSDTYQVSMPLAGPVVMPASASPGCRRTLLPTDGHAHYQQPTTTKNSTRT